MSKFSCIKLNASWEPIEILRWEDVFDDVYIHKKMEALWFYPDEYKIRSQFVDFKYPAIAVLKHHVKRRPIKTSVSPSLKSILSRDMYVCQYCGALLTNSTGTRDHVIPESKGGKTIWKNLVASCRSCQNKKADKMPHECNMYPINEPTVPLLEERIQSFIKKSSQFEKNSWKLGFRKLGLTHLLGD